MLSPLRHPAAWRWMVLNEVWFPSKFRFTDTSGGGQGGGRPGEKGAGGVWEAGEEGAGSGIPKVAGSGRKREKLRNISQYFAIEKMQRGGSQKIQGGNRD